MNNSPINAKSYLPKVGEKKILDGGREGWMDGWIGGWIGNTFPLGSTSSTVVKHCFYI